MNTIPQTCQAAVLKAFQTPADIALEQIPVIAPGPREVLLASEFAPINPADLNILEGKYGELPELPAVVGNEGSARVVAKGEEVFHLQPGDLVLPMQRGTWCQMRNVIADDVIPLPAETDPQQASMLSVNPATALLLLREIRTLRPGDWVAQNAGNSGVGRSVIQIARELGLRTISIVRRPELVAELKVLGGDVVLLEEEDIRTAVKDSCGSNKPGLALNSVGGASALQLANILGPGGIMATFGAMSKQPLKIPNGLLIFKDLRFQGFWLTRWLNQVSRERKASLYRELAGWVNAGKLHQPVEQVVPLANLPDALTAAARDKRAGKILLDLRTAPQ